MDFFFPKEKKELYHTHSGKITRIKHFIDCAWNICFESCPKKKFRYRCEELKFKVGDIVIIQYQELVMGDGTRFYIEDLSLVNKEISSIDILTAYCLHCDQNMHK